MANGFFTCYHAQIKHSALPMRIWESREEIRVIMDNSAIKPAGREATKAWHRQKILDATITVIAQHGIVGTTISRVVEQAGLSRGMVNLHFKSKDSLLMEVIKYLLDQYIATWHQAMEEAGDSPADKIKAMICADFNPRIFHSEAVAVWFAFRVQARAQPEYLPYVTTREDDNLRNFTELFVQLVEETGCHHIDPGSVARGMMALEEGMWLDFFLHPQRFDSRKALRSAFTFLAAIFPDHFDVEECVAGVEIN